MWIRKTMQENGEGEREDRNKSFEQLAKETQDLIWGV